MPNRVIIRRKNVSKRSANTLAMEKVPKKAIGNIHWSTITRQQGMVSDRLVNTFFRPAGVMMLLLTGYY